MRHIKHNSIWVSLVIILPLFWKGITSKKLPGYSIDVRPSVSVQEGLCVTIPCNFTANQRNRFSNSFGYWMLDPPRKNYIVATNDKSSDVRKANFNLMGNPDTGDCTLTVTDARTQDAGIYFYRFEESKDSKVRYNFNEYVKLNITVTDLTEEPVISDPGTVIAGINKTLTCSPPGNCSATSLDIQWKKSNVAGVWKNSSTVTFTPSLYDLQENITCQMTNSKGKTTQKTILLDVCCPPAMSISWDINGCIKEKKISVPASIEVDEGSSVALKCSLQSNLELTMIWMDEKKGILRRENATKLRLNLGNMTMNHSGTYTCSALTKYVINLSINITVQRQPRNIETTNNRSKDEISYRDIAIAFICGLSTTFLILLLYKLISRKQMTKKANYVTREETYANTEPPTEDIYMNVKKPEDKAEEATDNNEQLDSNGATLDEDDLHYSTVTFTANSSKMLSSQPETEYAVVKVKD